jgi:membrane-bound lytic murein transglycosylase F
MKKAILIIGSFGLVLLVLLMVILRHQTNRDLNDILKEGRLTVLIDSGEHGFTRDSAKVAGFQYELIKLYTDELGVELVILQEPDHEKAMEELIQGDCDVLVSLQPIIADSGLSVVSLIPIVETNLVLVQRPDSVGKLSVTTQYQLDGLTISVTKASPYKEPVKLMAGDLAIEPILEESRYPNLDALVNAVAKGESEYTICPEYLVKRLATRYPQVDFSLPLSFHLQLGWTIKSSSTALRDSLNEFLSGFIGSAEYWSLFSTYFDENTSKN